MIELNPGLSFGLVHNPLEAIEDLATRGIEFSRNSTHRRGSSCEPPHRRQFQDAIGYLTSSVEDKLRDMCS